MGEHWDDTHWLLDLPGKWELSRVAVERGEIQGFIVATRKPGTVHIHRMAVDHEARGRGLGAALLRAVAGAAVESGCLTLSLKVDPRNHSARRFYTALGFTTVEASARNLVMTAQSQVTMARPSSDSHHEGGATD
jgi:ribosomal protein S18 acetylase RimI-like enzyme